VLTRSGEVAWRVDLPKKITKGLRGGVAFLSECARAVLRDFLEAKRVMRESMAQTAPLFRSSQIRRLSLRRVQGLFGLWQGAAGFERIYNFHTLRHTAIIERLPGHEGPLPHPAVRPAREPGHNGRIHPSQ
jgi:site-specific recombinase XerD